VPPPLAAATPTPTRHGAWDAPVRLPHGRQLLLLLLLLLLVELLLLLELLMLLLLRRLLGLLLWEAHHIGVVAAQAIGNLLPQHVAT
jgi:hypothetical protein